MRGILLLVVYFTSLFSQALEPRLYSNAPVNMNFLALAYVYTNGTLPNNPELNLQNANLEVNIVIAAYVHIFELFGQSAKVDLFIPRTKIDGDAIFQGSYITRKTQGLGDIKTRFSLNLYGAPALSLKEFSSYKQDLIVGTSFQITAPTGTYDDDRLVNISNNRWAFKPSIGISQGMGNFIAEVSGAIELYTDNNDFIFRKREQDPIYSTQAHLIYNMPRGMWLGLDANYFWGGETTVNGNKKDDKIKDSRFGITFSLPLSRQYSLKFYGNKGVSTRTGTDFDMYALAIQYAFGEGL